MGERGPKPKPTELKLALGNPGKRKLPTDQPKPNKSKRVPTAPKELGKVGKAAWRRLAKVLHPLGLLTDADLDRLLMYCEAYEEFVEATELIQREGRVAFSEKTGNPYLHPAVGIKNAALSRMRQYGNDLGLSPSARVGLETTPEEEQDELGLLIDRAG